MSETGTSKGSAGNAGRGAPAGPPGGGGGASFRPIEGPAPAPAFSTDDALAELRRDRRQAAAGGDRGANGAREAAGRQEEQVGRQEQGSAGRHEQGSAGRHEDPAGSSAGDGGEHPDEGDEQHGGANDLEIMVDGRLQRVSLAELTQGYLRQVDYTRKTQGLGQRQQEVSEVLSAFQQARDHYQSRLDRFVTESMQEFDKPVDWVALAKSDPLGWQEKKARYDMLQEAKQEQAQIAHQRQLEQTNRKQNLVRAGHAMLEKALPGWKDSAARQTMQDEMKQYALRVGYSEQELAEDIVDPRQIVVLHDAAMGRKLREQKVQPRPAEPGRPASRGSAPAPQPSRRQREAEDAFDAKPTVNNALNAYRLSQLRPSGRR